MDAFFTKKRSCLEDSPQVTDGYRDEYADDESTDFKIATLSSLHPEIPSDILLDLLLENDGNVEQASKNLMEKDLVITTPPLKRLKTIGYQSSIASAFSNTSEGDRQGDRLRVKKPLTQRGKTLHLFNPIDIENNTPCSIIHNFLPAEIADALLKDLLAETPTYQRGSFQLFDKVVSSPHTYCFYVDDERAVEQQRTEYHYNGTSITDVRPLLPRMREVRSIVQEAVNLEIQRRIRDFYPDGKKLRYQYPGEWKPNCAFVNCYGSKYESVGYHTDQLTYLGPRAVIGSLSLGVTREFRIRKIIPADDDNIKKDVQSNQQVDKKVDKQADVQGQIAIHLPHNSLLVMHAEMQEEYKHSIAPCSSIDPHPLSGNKRLNITYRYYRNSFHPRFTPKCRCGVPACLRCVMKSAETRGRYMWMCDSTYRPGEKGCKFFEWAEFDEDGEPKWAQK